MESNVAEPQPRWQGLYRFVEFWRGTSEVATVYRVGTTIIASGMLALVLKAADPAAPTTQVLARSAPTLIERAVSEEQLDHPLVHSQLLVGLWGAFESFVDDHCVETLQRNPDLLARESLAKIRVRLADYARLATDEDRYRHLIAEVQRGVSADLKLGVGRFEAVLGALGLDGPVGAGIADSIYELQQVRNVAAHRAGIVDKRLAEACPGRGYVVGERVIVTQKRFEEWNSALLNYALIITGRVLTAENRLALVAGLREHGLGEVLAPAFEVMAAG